MGSGLIVEEKAIYVVLVEARRERRVPVSGRTGEDGFGEREFRGLVLGGYKSGDIRGGEGLRWCRE